MIALFQATSLIVLCFQLGELKDGSEEGDFRLGVSFGPATVAGFSLGQRIFEKMQVDESDSIYWKLNARLDPFWSINLNIDYEIVNNISLVAEYRHSYYSFTSQSYDIFMPQIAASIKFRLPIESCAMYYSMGYDTFLIYTPIGGVDGYYIGPFYRLEIELFNFWRFSAHFIADTSIYPFYPYNPFWPAEHIQFTNNYLLFRNAIAARIQYRM